MTDKELDEIYDTAFLLIEHERWSLIDDLLGFYANAAWRMDVDMLLGWATVTNPIGCRAKLKNRNMFIQQCIKFHTEEPDLWKGLE